MIILNRQIFWRSVLYAIHKADHVKTGFMKNTVPNELNSKDLTGIS